MAGGPYNIPRNTKEKTLIKIKLVNVTLLQSFTKKNIKEIRDNIINKNINPFFSFILFNSFFEFLYTFA